jgi:hypothetical protein
MTRMTAMKVLLAAGTLLLAAQSGTANASSIPKPAGARSWILIGSSDCDDDGPNVNNDRGHCIGAVGELLQAGDLGHGMLNPYAIFSNVRVGPETIRGSIQVVGNPFTFLDISHLDTFTLNSKSVPAGTVVPITVTFRAVGTMLPGPVANTFGGGTFDIRISNTMLDDPIVIPENARVGGPLGPNASRSFFQWPSPSGTPIPLDHTAFHTMDVTVGQPFDLAFYLAARPSAATIDFTNTATISFTVPDGTYMTSAGGFGQSVPVQPTTWGGLKARHN